MPKLWIALLLPAIVFAQYTFGPIRLDDGTDQNYFYPSLSVNPQGQIHSVWSSTSDARIAAFGRAISPDGQTLGPIETYQSVPPGFEGIVCPARLTELILPDQRRAWQLFHS